MKITIKRNLAFRMIFPIIAVTIIIGIIFYSLLLRTISDFALRQIELGLEAMSQNLYEIYDVTLDKLSIINDERAIRIEKANTLDKMERFARNNNIKVLIFKKDEKGIEGLNTDWSLKELTDLYSSLRGLQYSKISRVYFKGNHYYVFRTSLDLWGCDILILQNTEEYSALFTKVRVLYIITAIVLLSFFLFLIVYLRKIIREPLNSIITSIKKGERPQYKGIEEFEFLSQNIKGMMEDLERETRRLNYIYTIAVTKRGEEFFDEVVRAIYQLFGMNSAISRIEDDGKGAYVIAMYINGEIRKGFPCPIKGLPCEDVLNKLQLVVIERDVQDLYPNSELLRESKAESYLGFAIFNRRGEPIGILNCFGPAIKYSESDIKVLQTIGQVVALEIEQIEEEKEREEIKKQLFQAQKMEAIGILAGGIAHDFNNMLQVILGYVSLIKMKIPETDPIYKPIDVIEKTAERAAELTRQLLGFSRKGKYFVESLNINDIAYEAKKIISRTFDRAVEIKTELSEDVWRFEGDKGQLESVILNLCLNARDAMPGGGLLLIRTYNRAIKEGDFHYPEARPGRYVVLSVKDTGIGMDKETMKHIFEPFFTTKEIGKGTGMGLAMAYGIVKHHNGFITVDSKPGEGSTFTLYLPAIEIESEKDEVKEVKENKEIKAPAYGFGTILIVDDEEVVRNLLKDALSLLGYSIIEVSNGKEAVDIYRSMKNKIDLVILDLIMPEMGGEEAFRRLKEINPDIKILIATGYSEDGSLKTIAKDKGIIGFINKPFKITEISESIKKALN